jgi:LL-diaminopimelate aminotransferase
MKALSEPNIKHLYSGLCAHMETYIMFRIAQRVMDLTPELTAKGRAPLKMSIGAPTVDPPKVLLDYYKACLDEPGIHTYSVPKGEKFFRDAVATRMKQRFGVTVNPNNEVCALIGSKEGLANIFRAIVTPKTELKEQDIILTPDPGYASYVDAINIAGGHSYPVYLTPENNYLPSFKEAFQALQAEGFKGSNVKGLILNYPSNPIGAVAPFSYFEETVAFAREHNILIISDVAYSEMVFEGEEKPHSILEVPGAKDIAIEFHSLSKPYAITGWRLGFAVGHQDAIGILETVKSTVDTGLNKAMQKAAAFALTSPECDAFIQQNNKLYESNQDLMLKGFKSLGWPPEKMNLPRATFYFWLPIPPRYTSCEQFSNDLLEKSGIVVVPGTAFGKGGEGFVRLSLVTPQAEMEGVISRMKEDGFLYTV